MNNSNKYRTFDYSTNIIVSSKVGVHNYAPYQSVKQQSESKSSKKMEASSSNNFQPTPKNFNLNIKIFDRNKRQQRIMSRNDRNDLYLEGGQAIDHLKFNTRLNINTVLYAMNKICTNEEEKNRTLQNFFKERNYYRLGKIKNKSEVEDPPTTQTQNPPANKFISQHMRSLSRASSRQMTAKREQRQQQTVMIKSIAEQARKQSRQKYRKSLVNFVSTNSTQCTKTNITITKDPQKKKKYNSIQNHPKKTQKLTLQDKKSVSNDNLSKIDKTKRPLFYLQPKEISHIKADCFIVTQYPSGQIILGNYFRKVSEIASLTKIMTFYTVFQIAERFGKDVETQIIEVDQDAQAMTGTSAQIFAGDTYTVEQLLYGLMLPSGNDAAVALAKWAGNFLEIDEVSPKTPLEKTSPLKKFIIEMNKNAKILNMKNTRFANPHGLPHQMSGSNPQEMAILMKECLNIHLFRTVIRAKEYRCWVEHKGVKHQVVWENTNKLLRRPNFIGGKTGVTVTAGPCLASCYQLGEKILIVILLKTTKLSRRFKETRMIISLALNKLGNKEYRSRIKQIMRHDQQLDSDNSEDEQQFCYERSDARQMAKRNKILTFQM